MFFAIIFHLWKILLQFVSGILDVRMLLGGLLARCPQAYFPLLMLLKSLLHPVTAEHSLGQAIFWVNLCALQFESPEWIHGHHTVPAGVGCVPCVRTDIDGSRICQARDKSTDLNFMVFMWIVGWWDHSDQYIHERTYCLLLLITASLVIIQLCKEFIVNFFLKNE